MKIALYYFINFSGAKRIVQEHVKGLKALGNSVDIYTTDSAKDIFDPSMFADNKFLYNFTPKTINLPIIKRFKSDFVDTFITLRFLNKKIASDIDKKNYDIVLVHTDIRTQAPFVLRYLKTNNVYFCLEPLRNAYEYSLRLKDNVTIFNKFYEALNRRVRRQIDKENVISSKNILTISLFARERIIAAYDLYPKISYLGVDENIFKHEEVNKRNQVFFVAEKNSIYGYDLAEKAINLIPKDNRPDLKIVSWTSNNNERLSDEKLVNIYNQSLVTLSLSKFDTFGLVPLESMACGVPVIALNVAGYRETVRNGYNGYLVDFDPKEIAEKIIFLLNNSSKSKQMGKNGRKWIENNWTWKKHINYLNDLLLNMINYKKN